MRVTPLRIALIVLVIVGPFVGVLLIESRTRAACVARGGSYDYLRDYCEPTSDRARPALVPPLQPGQTARDGRRWLVGQLSVLAAIALFAVFDWQDRRRQRSRPVV